MEQLPVRRFSCPACGQRFDWHPQFAGKMVSCKCGATFKASLGGTEVTVPRPPPTVEEPARKVVSSYVPRGMMGRSVRDMAADTDDTGPFRDVILPSILLLIGVVLRFTQVLAFGPQIGAGRAVGILMCEIILGGVALALTTLATTAMMEQNLGDPIKAILKILAMWLIAAAAARFLAGLDKEPGSLRGIALAFHAVLIIYFFLYCVLFKFDLQAALAGSAIGCVAQFMVLAVVAKVLSTEAAKALFFG